MSESEKYGPTCCAELLPTRRRKLSIRPCASSCSRIVGMLRSTLVFRRLDQKPSSIVTAWTGTLCNFAYGEFATLMTPWSCQAIRALVAPPRSNAPRTRAASPNANERAGVASTEAAEEVAAVEINCRREMCRRDAINHLKELLLAREGFQKTALANVYYLRLYKVCRIVAPGQSLIECTDAAHLEPYS